jgi:hypothetical protein
MFYTEEYKRPWISTEPFTLMWGTLSFDGCLSIVLADSQASTENTASFYLQVPQNTKLVNLVFLSSR